MYSILESVTNNNSSVGELSTRYNFTFKFVFRKESIAFRTLFYRFYIKRYRKLFCFTFFLFPNQYNTLDIIKILNDILELLKYCNAKKFIFL
jgi:hypothetical protein